MHIGFEAVTLTVLWQARGSRITRKSASINAVAIDVSNRLDYPRAMPTPTSSVSQLQRAIQIAEQIERLQADLNRILGAVGSNVSIAAPATAKAGRAGKRSSAARKRMGDARKSRRSTLNATNAPAAAPKAAKPAKKKGKMSAAGRAAIVAAQKARWAIIKAKAAPEAVAPAKVAAAPAPTAKPAKKRKISAEARAKMVAGAKARWAKKAGA